MPPTLPPIPFYPSVHPSTPLLLLVTVLIFGVLFLFATALRILIRCSHIPLTHIMQLSHNLQIEVWWELVFIFLLHRLRRRAWRSTM